MEATVTRLYAPPAVASASRRVAFATLIGLFTVAFSYLYLHVAQPHTLGYDFTWPWRAARALLDGQNPYVVVRQTAPAPFPFDGNFLYPLPAAFVALPFAWMPPDMAAATFGGVSAGLLAFGLSATGYELFPLFLSPPFIVTACSGQWSTLMMAATVLPAVSWLAVCKPTVGGAAFLAKPRWKAVLIGGALLAVSFLVLPTWVSDWMDNVRLQPGHRYIAPYKVWLAGGPLLLLAALRWRRWEARWLFVLALAPQVLTMYSAFPPMLVAKTRREALTLSALSCIAYLGIMLTAGDDPARRSREPVLDGYWLIPLVFLPALVMVLKRPNRSDETMA